MSLEALKQQLERIRRGETVKVTVDPEYGPILRLIRRIGKFVSRVMWGWVMNE
jgi:hypothetical protein